MATEESREDLKHRCLLLRWSLYGIEAQLLTARRALIGGALVGIGDSQYSKGKADGMRIAANAIAEALMDKAPSFLDEGSMAAWCTLQKRVDEALKSPDSAATKNAIEQLRAMTHGEIDQVIRTQDSPLKELAELEQARRT